MHFGYVGRLSSASDMAFVFTRPEVSVSEAYRFKAYHLMRARALSTLFPLEVGTIGD